MSLLSVDTALLEVLSMTSPLEAESVSLTEALGRATAHPVVARRTLPATDTSAMDGYACLAAHTREGLTLKVEGASYPGQRNLQPLVPSTVCRITTGAPLPEGADAVVQQEHVDLHDGRITIRAAIRPGLNVRRRGEDTVAGSPLLAQSQRLGVAEIAALVSQGATEVSVRRRPVVAIAASGDELVPFGSPADERHTIDSNSVMLALAAGNAGAKTRILPIAPDTLSAVAGNVRAGLEADVLLCVAGASVGDKDFTRHALKQEGVSLMFWRVAMKPGKPLALGRAGKTLVFGLPGNPVSALVTFELFVRPALLAAQGLDPAPTFEWATLSEPIQKTAGLRHFVRSSVRDGVVTPLPKQSSGALTSATGATHLIDLAEEVVTAEKDCRVRCLRLTW